jgi:hypothetical protein
MTQYPPEDEPLSWVHVKTQVNALGCHVKLGDRNLSRKHKGKGNNRPLKLVMRGANARTVFLVVCKMTRQAGIELGNVSVQYRDFFPDADEAARFFADHDANFELKSSSDEEEDGDKHDQSAPLDGNEVILCRAALSPMT